MAVTDLEAALVEARTALLLDGIPVINRAGQIAGDDVPNGGAYLIMDLVTIESQVDLLGQLYAAVLLQVGAWSDTSQVDALGHAENARGRLAGLDYDLTGGIRFARDEDFVGVLARYRLTAAFDTLT